MSKKTADEPVAIDPVAIDPRGEDVVLFYTGPGIARDIPGRDLHGGDLARAAYVRAFRALEGASRPEPATADELAALVDELLESGNYSRTKPEAESEAESEADPVTPGEAPVTGSTEPTAPVTPAEAPEA